MADARAPFARILLLAGGSGAVRAAHASDPGRAWAQRPSDGPCQHRLLCGVRLCGSSRRLRGRQVQPQVGDHGRAHVLVSHDGVHRPCWRPYRPHPLPLRLHADRRVVLLSFSLRAHRHAPQGVPHARACDTPERTVHRADDMRCACRVDAQGFRRMARGVLGVRRGGVPACGLFHMASQGQAR